MGSIIHFEAVDFCIYPFTYLWNLQYRCLKNIKLIWCTLLHNNVSFKYVGRIAKWICGGNVLQNIQLRDNSCICVCVDGAVGGWWQHRGIWSSENGHDYILCILRTTVFSCVSLLNTFFTTKVSFKVNIKFQLFVDIKLKIFSKLLTILSLNVQIKDV